MKKLLSMVTTITSFSSITPIVLANAPVKIQENKNLVTSMRTKRQVLLTNYYSKQKITGISDIESYYGSATDKEGNFYFATRNGFYIIKSGTIIAEKVVGINDSTVGGLIMADKNNNVYFGTTQGVYKLKPGMIIPVKIDGINNGMVGIIDSNDNVYFGTNNGSGAYVLKYGESRAKQIYGMSNKTFFTVNNDKENNTYFGTSDGAYILKPNHTTATKIVGVYGHVYYFVVDSKNNVFIGTQNGLYIKNGEMSAIAFEGMPHNIRSVLIDDNDNFYFGTNNGFYLLKCGETKSKKINGVTGEVHSIVLGHKNVYFGASSGAYVLKNNELSATKMNEKGNKIIGVNRIIFDKNNSNMYFLTYNDGIFKIKNKYQLNDVIKINNLKIDNNSDKSILNELNYLNPSLDISQLEIKEKDNTSTTIRVKSNSDKYFGENKIYYVINNQQNKIINLNELIKKGIFLSFRDKNKENIVKEIKNININNLIYSNVTVTKNIEPIINKTNENICSGKTILENNLPTEQKLRTSNCKYTIQEIKSFQITTGLSKTTGSQTNSEVSSGFTNSNSSTSSSQVGHSKIDSSSESSEVSGNAGFSLFGFSIGGSGGGGGQTSSTSETSSLTSYSSTQDITKSIHNSFSNSISLSNSFDLGNSQEMQNIKIFELELPFQELNIEGNQTIEVSTFLDKVLVQIILNLKQNINGEINAEIINENNEKTIFEISIKEIMQKLKQYNLLPQEITINNDNNITFNGKANLSYQGSTIGKTKLTEIETF
ncbi:hypothetical protein [Spiroplasma endosymbiont of Dromius quadrimaculatus]|uniref:hypothetical protein n=1 Tax=Spiroplasma endosymbiont of Dromius quadrimaculatus TaxID=3066283 RepID=UPI00313F394C